MKAKRPKLKPCPWCGKELMLSHSSAAVVVSCDNPECSVQFISTWFKTPAAAVAAVNRRQA